MSPGRRFDRPLATVPDDTLAPLDEVRVVVDDYLTPAAAALKQSSDEGDVDAIRAYAYELLAASGSVIAACPLPRPRDDASRGRR